MLEFLYSHSYIVLGLSFVLIALILIVLVFIVASQSDNNQENDNPAHVIIYNQNGYHSNLSGYQTGKFTKNNTYNGR